MTNATLIPDASLTLGGATTVPDGTWYAIAVWNSKRRDYFDDPAKGLHPSQDIGAMQLSLPVGSRLVRYTVSKGYVTTRRGLGG